MLAFFLHFTANLFLVCIAVSYARQSFVLKKETRKFPFAFPVETLNPKHEEQTGAADVCSQKRLAVAYPR